jgi:glycosyltransferase involved in cell wall biosynthesis
LSHRNGKRQRVLQITQSLGLGGLEQVVQTLCTSLDPERFDPRVLCLRNEGPIANELRGAGIPVTSLQYHPDRVDRFSFVRVAEMMRRENINVVHTHNTDAFLTGVLAARMAGVRTVVHTDHARAFPDRLRYMVAEHLASRVVYRVVGVSEHTTQNLAHYIRVPRRKLVTIPNGVDGAAFRQGCDPAEARAALGLTMHQRVIGTGARLTPQKALHVLIEAVALVAKRVPDVVLVIAGEGPEEAALREAAARFGILESVRFAGYRRDMPRLLAALDVYALSSVWEGLPMAVLEALAAGCPVVSTDVGGVATAVQHEKTGLLVPKGDAAALAVALERALTDESLRCSMVCAGRRAFDQHFSARAMTERYEALYERRHPAQ